MAAPNPTKEKAMPPVRRAFRYSLDCPTGRMFVGAEAIAAAEKDGWVDSPGAVTAAPPVKKKAAPVKKKAPVRRKVAAKKVAASDDSQ